ncbi:MAG: [FeFe] hydrogenase H-cluster maturation GTPase HydF [Desulfovibrio sp.]|jgi:[FeFe] hydrogenase H-cluster maturation GTPase HydF|nr:[FeFe] hydrogenase H-cluster maturation GTPase HydF [Desulfovibrio sp.]
MNETPSGERPHIGFFGRRNVGKSSLLNAVAGQEVALVSPVKGTTTDPVRKAMELLPVGPVMLVDTPGMDDEGELGELRVRRAARELARADAAVLVADAVSGLNDEDRKIRELCAARRLPLITVYNKCDLAATFPRAGENELYVSAARGDNIETLRDRLATLLESGELKFRLVGDLLHPADFAVLVTPIDKAAPEGRLILPQQQAIRDILEADATAVVVKEHELRDTLASLGKKPALVITDSQVFAKVSADTPEDVPMTSFSILMARYKGMLDAAVAGVKVLDSLEDGDRVLICEGCTHRRQCDDIGTVKLPRWIRQYTGKKPDFVFASGVEFPERPDALRLIVHCGGCMLTRREMQYRRSLAEMRGVPITNYGVLIACMQGILPRVLSVFPYLRETPRTERRPG